MFITEYTRDRHRGEKVKIMENIIKNIRAKAAKISAIMLGDLISDVDLLTVALSMGNINQIAETVMTASEGSCQYIAAHRAIDIGWKPPLRDAKVRAGYFSQGLIGLIELSKHNPVLATRLIPVWGEMLHKSKELGISNKLKHEAEVYMQSVFEHDGFAITHIDNDGYVEVTLNEPKLKCMALANQFTP